MQAADRLPSEDLPDSPHARQLRMGFSWLTFDGALETEFRRSNFDEHLVHIRVNLCLGLLISIAFSGMDSVALGPELNRVPSTIHVLIIMPVLLIVLAASFSPQ